MGTSVTVALSAPFMDFFPPIFCGILKPQEQNYLICFVTEWTEHPSKEAVTCSWTCITEEWREYDTRHRTKDSSSIWF